MAKFDSFKKENNTIIYKVHAGISFFIQKYQQTFESLSIYSRDSILPISSYWNNIEKCNLVWGNYNINQLSGFFANPEENKLQDFISRKRSKN